MTKGPAPVAARPVVAEQWKIYTPMGRVIVLMAVIVAVADGTVKVEIL